MNKFSCTIVINVVKRVNFMNYRLLIALFHVILEKYRITFIFNYVLVFFTSYKSTYIDTFVLWLLHPRVLKNLIGQIIEIRPKRMSNSFVNESLDRFVCLRWSDCCGRLVSPIISHDSQGKSASRQEREISGTRDDQPRPSRLFQRHRCIFSSKQWETVTVASSNSRKGRRKRRITRKVIR